MHVLDYPASEFEQSDANQGNSRSSSEVGKAYLRDRLKVELAGDLFIDGSDGGAGIEEKLVRPLPINVNRHHDPALVLDSEPNGRGRLRCRR